MALLAEVVVSGINGGTTASIDTTGATGLVALIASFVDPTNTPTDSKGNTWTAGSLYPGDNSTRARIWYCDAPTSVGTGHTLTWSQNGTYATITFMAFDGTGAFDKETGNATAGDQTSLTLPSITPAADGSTIVTVIRARSALWTAAPSIGGGFSTPVYTASVANTNDSTATSYLIQGPAAAVSVAWSWSGGSNATSAALVLGPAAPAGPTIDTQPTASTVVLTNASSTTFTVAATASAGSLTYQWQLEDGVGAGTYTNVANGSGLTFTNATTATLGVAITAKTLSGRKVRCNVTDDNGTTATDAVVLTIYDGPQVTTFPATNGSGVSTATLTCDYPTGTGEAIEVAIPLSDGTLRVTCVVTTP